MKMFVTNYHLTLPQPPTKTKLSSLPSTCAKNKRKAEVMSLFLCTKLEGGNVTLTRNLICIVYTQYMKRNSSTLHHPPFLTLNHPNPRFTICHNPLNIRLLMALLRRTIRGFLINKRKIFRLENAIQNELQKRALNYI